MKEKKLNLVLTHKILFWVTIVMYLIDLIAFGAIVTLLTTFWVFSSFTVFVLSIILLSQKPKKKTFVITALCIMSIPVFLFLMGFIIGVI